MKNKQDQNPWYTCQDKFIKDLAKEAVLRSQDLNSPNAESWKNIKRNTGFPNEYLEFKPKEPEQYNLPEFKPSSQTDYFKKEDPFKHPPTPSFKNWEEVAEWLEKGMPTNVEIPKNAKPTNLQALKTYYDQPYRKPEFKPASPQPVKAPPELKPFVNLREDNPFLDAWALYNYTQDNINDSSIRGVNVLFNLGKYGTQKLKGEWPPKYDESNPGFISHKNAKGITYDDYLEEMVNGGNPKKRYATWSDTDPIYSIRPQTKTGVFWKGYLTRQMDKYPPTKIAELILTRGARFLDPIDQIMLLTGHAKDLYDAYKDVKEFEKNEGNNQ